MSAKRPALGRGLDAIFSASASGSTAMADPTVEAAPPAVPQIPIHQIRPNPFQPRKEFDPEKLGELTASIREKGILQPIVLRTKDEHYEIVAGERRWRACQQAGLTEIPAIIRDFGDQEMMEAALIENLQRENLNAVDEARAFENLTRRYGMTQEALAEGLGKSRVSITNSLRLLRLPAQVLARLQSGSISAGHGRALLTVENSQKQIKLAKEIVARGLSVREVERQARQLSRPEPSTPPPPSAGVRDDVQEMEAKLSESLGLRVKIRTKTNNSGSVQIAYGSLEDFERLSQRLGMPSETGT